MKKHVKQVKQAKQSLQRTVKTQVRSFMQKLALLSRKVSIHLKRNIHFYLENQIIMSLTSTPSNCILLFQWFVKRSDARQGCAGVATLRQSSLTQ